MRAAKPLGAALLVVLFVGLAASAQVNSLPVDVPGTNELFFQIRYEGTEPPYAKAHQIWNRLNQVFFRWVDESQDPNALGSEDVTVSQTAAGHPAIFLKDTLVVEVDEFHAQYNRATPAQLADMWAANLRKGVTAFVQTNVKKN